MISYEMTKKKKRTKFDFHLDNIKRLHNEWQFLKSIPNFPYSNINHFYTRNDESGWWMAIKQTAIRGYIRAYLNILGKNVNRKLFFIDLMSSFGLNCVTKSQGRDKFTFPGTSINAALISRRSKRKFDGFYINDYNLEERTILNERLMALNATLEAPLNINIDLERDKIDSNEWVIETLKKIKEENSFFHYLMIIDNEAMEIRYDTLTKIREIHDFGDIIITFQDASIARAIPVVKTSKVSDFFGCEIPVGTKRPELCKIYQDQLGLIGLTNIEKMRVASETGFYYTLLFCCREDSSGKWLDLIKFYNDKRFNNFTDNDMKSMWDIAMGKQKSILSYR